MTDTVTLILEIIGTIAFAISGALVGIEKRMDILGVAILGATTAVGGGVMRDIMSGDIPFVFRKYFYCSASIIGAVVTAALWDTIGAVPAMLLGAAVIVLLRFLAARFRWRLPRAVTDGDIDAGDLTVRRASADGREDGSADDKRG